MKSITEAGDLRGKYVVLRSSLNLPVIDGVVQNEFRLLKALPTMRYLHEAGARTIVLAHIGREPDETFRPVFETLSKYLPAQWGGKIGSEDCRARREMMVDGDLLLLENTRQDVRYKNNESSYDEEMAALGEVFVFDAFAVAHRDQASVTGPVAHLPSFAGLTFVDEVQKLSGAMQPAHPSLFLLGGAKFDTKLPLIEKYLDLYNNVFVAGALINDILKAKGYEVGASLVSDVQLADTAFLENDKLLLPVDLVVSGPNGDRVCDIAEVTVEEKILDVGPATVAMLSSYIDKAATILWNGPFGYYEGGYTSGTEDTACLVAEAEANTILGGGDTVAAVEKLGLNDQFSHVSIGGGAMLQFLEKGTLPVIEALREK